MNYHFVDPDLRVDIFFVKEGTLKNGSLDFEIGDKGTSTHLYWMLKKSSCRACLLFNYFFDDKKYPFKAFSTCTFIPSLLNSFNLPSYSSKTRKKYTLLKAIVVSRDTGGRTFLLSWERLGGDL